MRAYVFKGCDNIITSAVDSFIDIVEKVTGERYSLSVIEKFGDERGFVFCLFDDIKNECDKIFAMRNECCDDGFIVKRHNDAVFIVSHSANGVYYGAQELVERNLPVVFSRGAADCCVDFIRVKRPVWRKVNFICNTPFRVRSWNMCGVGSEGVGHVDDGTAEFFAKNKCNAMFFVVEEEWRRFGLICNGSRIGNVQVFDDLIMTNPEFFMTDENGAPKSAFGGYESYPNYYNDELPSVLAKRITDNLPQETDVYHWTMPDSSYFYVKNEKGICLHEQPFVSDDGITVYPQDAAYKSTVYFNFLNRLARRVNEIKKGTYISVFSYIYSEPAPNIEIDKHLIILYAPIRTNERYSYIDKNGFGNDEIRNNIEKWSKKTKNLYVYTYWQSFCSSRFSRPVLKVVKENLLWFESLSVKGVTVEGSVDCSDVKNPAPSQKKARLAYDMNQFYIWAICKLLWNPNQSIKRLTRSYVKIVYGECRREMLKYFRLIQKGWDLSKTSVSYNTGGDVYYLRMIIKNGLDEKIEKMLKNARKRASSPEIKRKINNIYDTVHNETGIYKNFIKETPSLSFREENRDILTKVALDYVENPESFWNKIPSLTILRNNVNMEFYPAESKFSCKIAYDKNNLYFGYTVFDDKICRAETQADGRKVYYRDDGSEVISCAETYIGGDVFNQSVYYGYISGFMGIGRNEQGEFYKNTDGNIAQTAIPEGVKTVSFAKFDCDPEKRYYFHVQVIPYKILNESFDTVKPYGSFVYTSNRYGTGGWMGYGLWCKDNFQSFLIKNGQDKINER